MSKLTLGDTGMKNEIDFRTSHHAKHVTGIDGLRTIAVIAVIIYHLIPNRLPGGYLGVPLFLLISGYFISYQFSRRLAYQLPVNMKSFYERRFKRLYPFLIAMLLMTTAYITLFARELLHQIRVIVLTNLLWVYNWWEIGHGQSYFDQFGGQSPFTHLWTLGVEAQFYLLFPLLLIALFKLVKRQAIVRRIILVLAILSAIEMACLYQPGNINRVYYGTDTRAFSLLLGAWLGMAWPLDSLNDNAPARTRQLLNGVGIIALIVTIVSFLVTNGQASSTYHGVMFAYSVVGMVLLAIILHPAAQMNRWLTNPVFTWFGKRSYGIYVYQLPVMIFYERAIKVGYHPVISAIEEVALILIIAELSYQLIERPIAHVHWNSWWPVLRSRLRIPPFHWTAWLMTVVAGAITVTAIVGLCLPDRTPQQTAVQKKIEQNANKTKDHNQQLAKGKNVKTADVNTIKKQFTLSKTEARQARQLEVTAIGDSVMEDAADSIQKIMPHAYVDAQVGRQGSATPAVIKKLKSQGNLHKIVILNLGNNGPMTTQTIDQILSAIGSGHQIYWVTAHVPTKTWQQQVNRQIKGLAKQHKDIHVVDWYTVSQGHDDWFAKDHVHMDEAGNVHYARLIVKTILKNQK